MERLNKQNPMAKDLRQPKYKQRVIPDKKKPKPVRKQKHKGDKDEVYQWPYTCMPGIAGKPFFNNRKSAEASMSKKDRKLREKCYQREVLPEPGVGDVLFYRMDLWHRGTPIKPNCVRYVHNLAWKKKEAEGINIWNKGWTQQMYYGWLEEFIASINNEQRKTVGFPDITTLPNEIKQAVLLRYKNLSKL